MLRVKLVALDLDGTLLERDGTILPELRDALIQLSEKGVKVTTASGRFLESQLEFLEPMGLGAKVEVPHALITNEQEIYIASAGRYVSLIERNSEIERAWLKAVSKVMDLLRETLSELESMGFKASLWAGEEEVVQRHLAGLLFEEIREAKEAERYLKNKIKERRLNFKCNRSGRLVQVLLPFAGKGETVKVLAEYWNIEFSKVLCIGDSSHDMDMLDGRYGFIPATVSNADEEIVEVVRRVGGYVSPLPHGRGVLDVLKNFKLIE